MIKKNNIGVIIFALTNGEEERPHQSEMVARDERQHDFPRPTGQSQEGDPMWSHSLFFFYRLAVSKRFPLVVDFKGQFFDLTLVLSRRKLNVSKKKRLPPFARGRRPLDQWRVFGNNYGILCV